MGSPGDNQGRLPAAWHMGDPVLRRALSQQGQRVVHKAVELRDDKGVDLPLEAVAAPILRKAGDDGKGGAGGVRHRKAHPMTAAALGTRKPVALPLYLTDYVIGNQTVHDIKFLFGTTKIKNPRGRAKPVALKFLFGDMVYSRFRQGAPFFNDIRL